MQNKLGLYLTYDYSDPLLRSRLYSSYLASSYEDSLRPRMKDASFSFSAEELRRDGITILPAISAKTCDLILKKHFSSLDTNSLKKSIQCEDLVRDPVILYIYSNWRITRLVQRYLGIFPSIQFIAAWQTHGGIVPERTDEMYWHMDHHGHKFVKAFYYLNSVSLGYGHHQFITGTHNQIRFDAELAEGSRSLSFLRTQVEKKRQLRGKFKMSDDAVWPLFSRTRNIIGRSGTGFAEDTRGLHRGTPLPPGHSRVILQCLYTAMPNGKDRDIPIQISNPTLAMIQTTNFYTKSEMNKLFEHFKAS